MDGVRKIFQTKIQNVERNLYFYFDTRFVHHLTLNGELISWTYSYDKVKQVVHTILLGSRML